MNGKKASADVIKGNETIPAVSTRILRTKLGPKWASQIASHLGMSRQWVHRVVVQRQYQNPIWQEVIRRLQQYEETRQLAEPLLAETDSIQEEKQTEKFDSYA